jgi:DNA-directed RNA polymerase beta' subunit
MAWIANSDLEMNIFLPQSIKTQIELEEIAGVERQIISPASSRTSIGVVQDGLLGAYNMTHPSMKIKWRAAMNIIANSTLDDFSFFKKRQGEYTGKELYSLIVPKNININRGELQMEDGVLLKGQMGKDLLGAKKKNNLVQLIWDEYGIKATKNFLDNTQWMINSFNLYNGFTVGIGDIYVPDDVKLEIANYIATIEAKVNNKITNKENNPDFMDEDIYEMSVYSELNVIREDVAKMVYQNLPDTNNFKIMMDSGSKGGAQNMGQMAGCVGLQSSEGGLIKKKYNRRTLAFFHQDDDRAISRGLIKQSYQDGLEYPEFVYHALTGREGLIDQSIKSVTGDTRITIMDNGKVKNVEIGPWIDRKLKKNSKDVKHEEELDMELLDIKSGLQIPTTDDDGNISWGEIKAITRHDPGKELYKIETHGGRDVIVTESKSLIVWDDMSKKFVMKHTPDITTEDFVPVTMNLAAPPVTQNYIEVSDYLPKTEYMYGTDFNIAKNLIKDNTNEDGSVVRGWFDEHNGKEFTLPYERVQLFKRCLVRSNIDNIKTGCVYPYSAKREDILIPERFPLNKENGLFIGLFLAEGNVDIKSGYVQITNNDPKIKKFVKKWFNKFSIKHSEDTKTNMIGGTSSCVRGYSTTLAKLLTKLMGHGARNKFVPNEAFNSPDDFVRGLINGYMSGDGTVTKTSIQVTSASKVLIEGIAMLLSRFGIFGKMTTTHMKSNNVGTADIADINMLTIRSSWATKFAKEFDFISSAKAKAIRKMDASVIHKNFRKHNDVVLDKIVKITPVDVNKYPKVYDLTIPSTLNFSLANGLHVRDTAETGYAQRKLVKSLEDIRVDNDGTVRLAGGQVIQMVYGDSGADTTKQYEYKIKLLSMSNSDLKEKLTFSKSELSKVKNFEDYDNKKLFHELRQMRNRLRTSIIKSRMDYRTLPTSFMLPVNLNRIIDNTSRKNKDDNVINDGKYIISKLESVINNENTLLVCMSKSERADSESFKFRDDRVAKNLFKIALYDALGPKRVIHDYKFNKDQFDGIIQKIIDGFNKNIIEPGQMVGIISAQSMGEPLTQMSSTKDTSVTIMANDKYYHGPIGSFVDDLMKRHSSKVLDVPGHDDSKVFDPKRKYYILTVNNDEKVEWKRIEQVSRHPANGKLIKVKTKSGRSTTTTLSHSHLKRTEDGIKSVKGSDLEVGHRIPVAFNIPEHKNALDWIDIGDEEYELDADLGFLFGAYLADGSLSGSTFKITKNNEEFKERIITGAGHFVRKISERTYRGEYGDGCDTYFTHKALCKFTKKHFGVGSYNKKIPGFVFASNKEFIGGLLNGYFSGDGNVHAKKSLIRVGSRSKQLIEDISLLCSYFGIFGSILEETKKSEPDKILYVYALQRKFAEVFRNEIGLTVKYKADELDEIVESNKRDKHCLNNFVDMIPCLGNNIAYIGKALKLPGQSRNYGRWKKKPAIGRETLGKYIETFEESLKDVECETTKEQVTTALEPLKSAYNSHIIWDEIVELEILDDPKEYVYDFTVPGNNTFMVDAGILVHNTLNAFHHAGIGSMSHTTLGVPRVKELLSVSKSPKTPQMMIYLKEDQRGSREMAHKIASHIKYTTLAHIRGKLDVYFDDDPYAKGGYMEKDHIGKPFYTRKGSRNSCQAEIDNVPYLIRIELSREKMIEKEVTLLEIKSKFCNWWEKRHLDAKSMKKEEKKVLQKITSVAILSNSDSDKQPIIHIRFNVKDVDRIKDPFDIETINNFIDNIIDKFKLKGINNVNEINAIVSDRLLTYGNNSSMDEDYYDEKDNEDENIQQEYIIYTGGVNLIDIRYIYGVDLTRTMSDSIVDVYETFGIEIARSVLMREIINAYERAGSSVNYQHVSILVDLMTANGYIMSIDRHGANKTDADPLTKASFEKTVEQLLTAAVFSETDHMKGMSARIMAGLVIKGGTGFPTVKVNTKMIENAEYVEDVDDPAHKTVDGSGIAQDIITNDKGSKDVFVPIM